MITISDFRFINVIWQGTISGEVFPTTPAYVMALEIFFSILPT